MYPVVSTPEELNSLLQEVSEYAVAAVVVDRDGVPWIVVEDDHGDCWAGSYPQDDEPDNIPAADLRLPLTVLLYPGRTSALQDIARERKTHAARGWSAEHDAEHGLLGLEGLVAERLNDLISRQMYGVPVPPETARELLVKAASILVAAIELIDRTDEK